MSKRLEALKELCTRYPYQKNAQKLKESEFDKIVEFIEEHDELGHHDFEHALNRMFLADPHKPKNWGIIQELLSCTNAAVHVRRRA